MTHLHEFASRCFEKQTENDLFVRAERRDDGMRTFRLLEGEPLETGFGEDLCRAVFVKECETAIIGCPAACG